MPDYPGTFIALEGSDGSGKATQFKLLTERLKAVGYEVETFDFPRYEQASSHFVRHYLNGEYGPAGDISPYSASLFYALDRFEAAPLIRKALEAGKVVLSNRYVGSNMAHQGAKFTNEAEQRGFFIWADSLEYQLLGIPRPSINLFLRLPAEVSQKLIADRAAKNSIAMDQHEADLSHLQSAVAAYDTLCRLFPKDFKAIDCAPDGQLLGIPGINDQLWTIIRPLLPAEAPRRPRGTVVKLDQKEPPPKRIPLRRTDDGQRDSPAPKTGKLSLLGYIEEAKSRGLSLEGLELGAKQPDYYAPNLPPEMLKDYQSLMKQLAGHRTKIRDGLEKIKAPDAGEILALLLPMATYCYMPAKDGLREPKLSARTNPAKRQLEKMAQEQIPANISTDLDAVTLLEAWPHNEFSLLSDSLYDVSDLPRRQVQAGIENWSYEQKYQALNAILGDVEPAVAEQVRYRWDVIAEQGLLVEMLLSNAVGSLQLQASTPRYGYLVPPSIEKAKVEEEFIKCFDLSLEMFSKLQTGKSPELAAYATLQGHRIRFQFSNTLANFKKLPRLRSSLFNDFLQQLLLKISENQPITAEVLRRQLEDKPGKTKTSHHKPRRRAK